MRKPRRPTIPRRARMQTATAAALARKGPSWAIASFSPRASIGPRAAWCRGSWRVVTSSPSRSFWNSACEPGVVGQQRADIFQIDRRAVPACPPRGRQPRRSAVSAGRSRQSGPRSSVSQPSAAIARTSSADGQPLLAGVVDAGTQQDVAVVGRPRRAATTASAPPPPRPACSRHVSGSFSPRGLAVEQVPVHAEAGLARIEPDVGRHRRHARRLGRIITCEPKSSFVPTRLRASSRQHSA